MNKENLLTQSQLKNIISYDPLTGLFVRLCNTVGHRKGDIAGYTNKYGYVVISINGVKYLAHRLAYLYMTGSWPAAQVDHIFHTRDDNRWGRIRLATQKENGLNQKKSTRNKSGIVGVSWNSQKQQWKAVITVDKKSRFLGYFDDKQEAIKVRKDAELTHGFHINHGS